MPSLDPAIRVATQDDLPVLLALVEGAYRGESARRGWTHEADLLGGQRTDADALAEILCHPRQRILIAETAGQVVGCVQVTFLDGETAYLGMLSVDPARQAAGIGRRLIAAAEQAASAHGASRIEMTVIRQRRELIEYYERRGYAQTGETRPFPYGDARFGLPRSDDLTFVVLTRMLSPL